MNPHAWRYRGACRGTDPELWFPIGTTGPALEQVAEAKAVCARCPVTQPCLEYALTIGAWGIWAGTTETEREADARERRNARRRVTQRAS